MRTVTQRFLVENSSVAGAEWAVKAPIRAEAIIPVSYERYGIKKWRNHFCRKFGNLFKIEQATSAHYWAVGKGAGIQVIA